MFFQLCATRDSQANTALQIRADDFSNTTFQQISSLLQQNPEYYTIWNYRRRLLQNVFQKELKSGNNAVSETAPEIAAPKGEQLVTMTLAQQEIGMLVKEDLHKLKP